MTTLFAIGSMGIAANKAKAQEPIKQDTFEYSNPVDKYTSEDLPEAFRDTVNLSSWTNDPEVLSKAPSPKFRLKGEEKIAKVVVDITNCMAYTYDSEGKAKEAFYVANGAPSSPTKPGIRQVISKMTYPYKNCSRASKRYRFPRDYGPKIAYMNIVDTITGALSDNGQYAHGTISDRRLLRKDVHLTKETKFDKNLLRENRHFTHGCTRFFDRDDLYLVNDVLVIGDWFKFVK